MAELAWLADNWDLLIAAEHRAATSLKNQLSVSNQKLAAILGQVMPEDWRATIKQAAAQLSTFEAALIDLLAKIPEIPGNPPRLYEAGDSWTTQLQANLSGLDVTERNLSARPNGRGGPQWNMAGAQSYLIIARAQQTAITTITGYFPEIRNALWSTALANATLIPTVAVACGTCVAAITAAAASFAAGPPGAVAGATLIVAAIAACIAFIGQALAALVAYLTAGKDAISKLRDQLAVNTGFDAVQNDGTPGVHWPPASVARENLYDTVYPPPELD